MDKREKKYYQMTQTRVEKLICSFAVPSIVSMLITSIYSIADSFFAGRLDTQSTAALGIVFSYMGIIQAVGFFFGHGSGNFISRALGAKKSEEAEDMAATGFISAIILTGLIALTAGIFIRPVLTFFGATPTVLPCAVPYFRYILIGTPFIAGSFVLNNQMRLQGNAGVAVWGILAGALLNIALDPLFMFVFDMGIAGAGLATAVAQMVGFTLLLASAGRNGGIRIRLRNFKPTVARYVEIAAGGLPSLARQGLLCVSTIILNNYAGVYGDAAIAAFSIVGRTAHLCVSIVIGFGQGFQPVCGYNYGAGLYDRVRRGFHFCTVISTLYCILTAVLGWIFAGGIISLFSVDDVDVIDLGARVIRAQCLTLPLNGFIITANMYLQNTRQTVSAVFVAMARQGLFLVPAIALNAHFYGLNGIIAAQPVSDILTFATAIPICIIALRRMK